VKTFKYIF